MKIVYVHNKQNGSVNFTIGTDKQLHDLCDKLIKTGEVPPERAFASDGKFLLEDDKLVSILGYNPKEITILPLDTVADITVTGEANITLRLNHPNPIKERK